MGYQLERGASVADDIGRVLSEQLAKAADALDAVDAEPEEAVHEFRKRCKKIRAAVRLVRPAVTGDRYTRINGLARDAARELATHREAAAMAATFDRLLERRPASIGGARARETIASALASQRRSMVDELRAADPPVARAQALLSELGEEIDDLELDETDFDAIGPGLTKTYSRGRESLDAAIHTPTATSYHELRKRAKYTRYHIDLLEPSAPTILEPLSRTFHDLTDALGDAHDLAVLGAWLRGGAVDEIDQLDDHAELRIVVDGVRSELEHRAVALGRGLYAETPKRFARRIEAYWETWCSDETRSPADRPA